VAAELASDSAGSRARAAKAIDKLPADRLGVTEADGPAVERALADPDPVIRIAAIHLVDKAAMRGEWRAIAGHLADPDPGVRDAATVALSRAWPDTRELILGALHAGDADAKRSSLAFLATRAGDPILVREALPALSDVDEGVRKAANDMLSAAGGLATWEAIAELGDAPLAPALIRFLADRDVSQDPATFERWQSAGQLAELADVTAEIEDPSLLLQLAHNPNADIEKAALAGLVRELDQAAADPKVPLNLAVFDAVGDRAMLRAPHVARALRETSFGVWEDAVKRSPSVADPELVPILVASVPAHARKAEMVLDAVTQLDPAWPARLADPASSAQLAAMLEVSGRIPPVAECAWCQAWMKLDKWKAMSRDAAKSGNTALVDKAASEIEAAQDGLQRFSADDAHLGGKLMWVREHEIAALQAQLAKVKDPAAALMGAAILDRVRGTQAR
jgi:hypothetical protein